VTDRSPDMLRSGRGTKPFHFEASWLAEDKCADVVTDSWKTATEGGMSSFYEAIKAVTNSLNDWSTNVLGDLEKRAKKLKIDLEKCRRRSIWSE